MTAVDNLIADLKAGKISPLAQPIVVGIDDFIAALQQLSSGPGGPAGGDLSGTYPNPTVAALQGRAVSNAAPGAGNVLTFTGGLWTPQAPTGGGPSLVQQNGITTANHSTGILMGQAPAQGNLLVAIGTDQTSFPTAGAGYSSYGAASETNDGFGVAFKIAGASESATQVPFGDAHSGTISLWEFTNGSPGIWTAFPQFTSASPSINASQSKTGTSALIVGMSCIRTVGVNPTSIAGATQQGTASGNSRSLVNFMATAPANPTQAITVNYAASQSGIMVTYSLS